jgi:hypothetical protein
MMQALRYYNHLNYYFHPESVSVAQLIIHRGQIHGAFLFSLHAYCSIFLHLNTCHFGSLTY